MKTLKSGSWWGSNPWLSMANNSAVFKDHPEPLAFADEWLSLWKSFSGERGIFNRKACEKQVLKNKRRKIVNENGEVIAWGTNPCSEIILRPYELCNLTEVVIRENDTEESILEKVKYATILGTLQSTLTNFNPDVLNPLWKENCENERLLGVSLTGIMDNKLMYDISTETSRRELSERLLRFKNMAVITNSIYAQRLGINPSAAITCVKPSGTVSQLVDCSSGIHPRFSAYYVRTVRCDKKDPMYEFLKSQGVPVEDEIFRPDNTAVFSFPVKSPDSTITRDLLENGVVGGFQSSPIQQLELWRIYQDYWCEHKPSITVYVKPYEWLRVGAWVYEKFEDISGVSFLPYDNGTYQQAPYQEISRDEYEERVRNMPKIEWEKLSLFEVKETKRPQATFACYGNSCENVDI